MAMGHHLPHHKPVRYYKYTQIFLCIMTTVVAVILLKGFNFI